MNTNQLKDLLSDLSIPDVRYFEVTGSTNDIALAWAEEGAKDYSLVVADAQNAGRGRSGHKWHTQSGAALAFSLVLRPNANESDFVPLFSPLGALAVNSALSTEFSLNSEIKWPNDVLINRQKVAGILVELNWLGGQLGALVVGIGINIAPSAIPTGLPLDFPATCIETSLGKAVDRFEVLHAVLREFLRWRPLLKTPAFLQAWEERLAFKGETVRILSTTGEAPRSGRVVGVQKNGGLVLQAENGELFDVQVGEVHLRPT